LGVGVREFQQRISQNLQRRQNEADFFMFFPAPQHLS
jgi:hypothetical protein